MTARSVALAVTGVLCVAMAPQAAAASEPNDYEAGVAARLDGRPADAQILLNRWLANHPDDADALLQLALTELALGRLDSAEKGFRAVLSAAPGYADAAAGLETVRARRQAAYRRQRPSLALEGAWSDLSRGQADWREVTLEIEVPVGAASAGGRISHLGRFGARDTELEAQTRFHPTSDTWFRVHAGVTPHADFRPAFSFGGGADFRLANAQSIVVTLDGAFQRFPAQDVLTMNPAITRYFDAGRIWVTLRGVATTADGGSLELGGLARIDHVPAERWRVFVGAADGPDTDLGMVARTSAVFAGVAAPIGPRMSITGSLSREWRGGLGDRTEFRLAIRTGL